MIIETENVTNEMNEKKIYCRCFLTNEWGLKRKFESETLDTM